MIKKIALIFLMCCLLGSCGKKGDPQYKDTEKKAKIKIILTNKV
tara:strand:- start:1257 stop:1388 length:132 start_codon:yes stop_codon:yes gene_type:complete